MHIPDGFLSVPVAASAAALSTSGVSIALRQAKRSLPSRQVPLLGLTAAFVFAAQMLNFPVAGGTSGHLIGSVLAAVLVGPSAAVIVLTAVLIVQCFLFADGGVTALGANIFNMALVAPLLGYPIFKLVTKAVPGVRGRLMGAMFAAWCSTVAAALACAGQLAASGTVVWKVALPAMGGVHMLIGVGEAAITGMVLAAIARSRPELLHRELHAGGNRGGSLLAIGLVVALGLAMFASPFASVWPDGLEKVADSLGFGHRAVDLKLTPVPLPDYAMPGVKSPAIATALAGGVGTLAVFIACYILARFLAPKPASDTPSSGEAAA